MQRRPARPLAMGVRARAFGAYALALLVASAAACSPEETPEPSLPEPASPEPAPGAEPTPPTPLELDADRVVKLYLDAPGSAFRLGDADLNRTSGFSIEEGTVALLGGEGGVAYWTVPTYEFEYTEGGMMGKTARVHLGTAGARQLFDWRDRSGFLAGPDDLGDQEFTAFVRVHGIFDPEHAAFELKIRGGQHTDDAPALASCTMMTFATADAPGVSRFGKELNHPEYDYVNLPLRFATQLEEGRWYALKLVSFADPERADRVVNRLYVDDDPFLPDGSPRNAFRLLTEYIDRSGVSTGRYDTLVNWRGVVTTLRIDGVESVDIARLSARAIRG
ncbi:MAG TPA: hypothetical protein VNN80_31495 [Polyangiaceae bacterium]|nr:hypothetical protein [Polyangiaceae bacterium]